MTIEEQKLELIRWIIEIQSPELLQRLLDQMEASRKEREERFLASYGAWQESESSDLMEDIYGSRHFEEKEIEL